MPSDVVTVDQIRDLIKSENIRPSDIFPMEKLVSDPAIKGYAEDRVRERIGGEYQHRRSAEEELEKLKKEFAPKEAALNEQIKALKVTAAKAQVGSLFEKQRGTRKLDERQVKFIQTRLERFTPSDPEKTETEFNTFLDSEIDEYGKIAKEVFGVDGKAVGKPDAKVGDGNTGDPGTGPDNNHGSDGAPENPYLDPAKNPMIKLA